MDWNKITLNQFNELQKALEISDETERLITISEIVFGEEVTNLPIAEFNKKIKELDFLYKEIPNNHLVKSIKVNGREYKVDGLLGHITTAQYIDFINHNKSDDIAKKLSVFFIPKGHTYNDEYDMLQVIEDMGYLPMDVVNSTAFFFNRQLAKFIQIFLSSLKKKVKKMKITEEQKQKILTEIQPLVCYPIF